MRRKQNTTSARTALVITVLKKNLIESTLVAVSSDEDAEDGLVDEA